MERIRRVRGRVATFLPPAIRSRLPQGALTRGVLVLMLGTLAAQGLLVLTSPILTRVYEPADLGVLSVYTAILSVLLTITCLSYELAIPLPEDELAAANVLALSLLVDLAMSVVAGLVLVVVGSNLLGAFGAERLAPFAILIAVGQFAGGLLIALTAWAIRARRFQVIAGTQVVQSGSLAGTQISLGLVGLGPVGLVIADVVSRAVAAATVGQSAWRTHSGFLRRATFRGVAEVASRYRRFPVLSTPSALLNTLGLQAPSLLVVSLYGAGVGGQLFLAQRIAAIPVTLLARSVGQVYQSEAARLVREDPTRMRPLFLRTTRSLMRSGAIPALLLAVAAPVLFGPVFGEEWREAGWYTAFLTPVYYLTLTTSPTGATLDVLERQDLHLVRETMRLVLVGGAVVLAAAIHLPALGAIAVLSVAGCLTYLMYGLISWWAIVDAERRQARTGS
ncbi:MAG TPA: oligosaccharide flippase family protein [Candidatus Limnocylindrales bacterium]|nr:oligosaccharide flippase family protein [Candidatus Limnocylindrales bacterium]